MGKSVMLLLLFWCKIKLVGDQLNNEKTAFGVFNFFIGIAWV